MKSVVTRIKSGSAFMLLLLLPLVIPAQQPIITIDECYSLARANYPAIKKLDLISKTAAFNIENASKRFLPQINFSGQATYQSQTIGFGDAFGAGLPGNITLPTLSKDQYRIQGEITQLIYDGRQTKNHQELITANAELQQQSIETSLYALRQRINTIFFSILLMDAQRQQNELKKKNLATQVEKAEAALKNGVAFRSSVDELKAEMVNIGMVSTELTANKSAYIKMLSQFVGKDLSDSVQFKWPVEAAVAGDILRPELKAFDLQKSIYATQIKQLNADYLPQVSAFVQGAYGRPTLNIVENKFGPWYVAGIRFNWSLGNLYTLPNRRQTLTLNQQSVSADKEVFLLNTKLDATLQDEQVLKYKSLIAQDNEVVALRSAVAKSAAAQLANGVITTHEFIQKINAEDLARQSKVLHEIQLMQAIYQQKFIKGIY